MSELPPYWVDVQAHSRVLPPPRAPWLLQAMAIAEALYATDSGPPPRDRLVWFAHELDDFLQRSGTRAALLIHGSSAAVGALGTLLAGPAGRLRPLHKLPLALRTHALERLEKSPAGLPLFAVKGIFSILYYEHPDAAREVGFSVTRRAGV